MVSAEGMKNDTRGFTCFSQAPKTFSAGYVMLVWRLIK